MQATRKEKHFEELKAKLLSDKNNILSTIGKEVNYNEGLLSHFFYTLKENYALKSDATSGSSMTLEGFRPYYDATVVKLLNEAGASMVAKVHADEFGLGGTGLSSAYGTIVNPLDNQRLVGGSSSGSVASMFYGINFSMGSDTGDSVRLPASYNGFVGFKPSYGLISRYGLYSYASSLDTVGYFTNNVHDAHLLTKVLVKKDPADMNTVTYHVEELKSKKPQKIAFLGQQELLHPDVKKEFNRLIQHLKKDGIEVHESPYTLELLNIIKPVYDIISYVEACSNLANIKGLQFGKKVQGKDWKEITLNLRSQHFGSVVQRRLTLGSFFSISENIEKIYYKAQALRNYYVNFLKKMLSEYDCFVYPSSSDVAPLITTQKKQNFMDWIVTGANLGGIPSITLKWMKKDNLPIGLTIDSKRFNDNNLLNYALYFENLIKDYYD